MLPPPAIPTANHVATHRRHVTRPTGVYGALAPVAAIALGLAIRYRAPLWRGVRRVGSLARSAVRKGVNLLGKRTPQCFVAGTRVWLAPDVALAVGGLILPAAAALNTDPRFNNFYLSAAVLGAIALAALGQEASQRKEKDRKRLELARAGGMPVDENGLLVLGDNVVPAWA